jgi:hypothetical protein
MIAKFGPSRAGINSTTDNGGELAGRVISNAPEVSILATGTWLQTAVCRMPHPSCFVPSPVGAVQGHLLVHRHDLLSPSGGSLADLRARCASF